MYEVISDPRHTQCSVLKSHKSRMGIHVPKFMSCHKAPVVMTRRAHCFHDCIYI